MSQPSFIPEGYNAVSPALAFENATQAIEWYKEVFEATQKMIFNEPSGKVAHAEVQIGDSVIFLADEYPQYNATPKTRGGNSINLCIYVKDVDATMKKAEEKGARVIMPAEDQFYGDRSGRFEDPFGYIWVVATPVKKVSEEEMKKMMDEMATAKES
jgi:PhnB protein